ncbi:MAG TPA: hypothetical protein VIW23_03890 [Candidatus Acidoferrum sp.]
MSSHHLPTTIRLALCLALSILLAASNRNLASVSAQTAQAKANRTRRCNCEFDTKTYEAFGTNAACGIAMSNKSHTCEISFSGTGGSPEIIKKILGDGAAQNQLDMAPQIFKRYEEYTRTGNKGPFLDPTFIQNSLVVLERSALFRESAMRANLPLKAIDNLFLEFSRTQSERIVEAFAGKSAPFDVEQTDGKFSVGEGYVELNFHEIARVRVVYFAQEEKR